MLLLRHLYCYLSSFLVFDEPKFNYTQNNQTVRWFRQFYLFCTWVISMNCVHDEQYFMFRIPESWILDEGLPLLGIVWYSFPSEPRSTDCDISVRWVLYFQTTKRCIAVLLIFLVSFNITCLSLRVIFIDGLGNHVERAVNCFDFSICPIRKEEVGTWKFGVFVPLNFRSCYIRGKNYIWIFWQLLLRCNKNGPTFLIPDFSRYSAATWGKSFSTSRSTFTL